MYRYKISNILEVLRALVTCKQKGSVMPQDYTKMFRTPSDAFNFHTRGPNKFARNIKKMKE